MATKRRAKLNLDALENKDRSYWYYYFLFRDKEFTNEATQFKAFLRKNYTSEQLSVGYDLEFLRSVGESVPEEHIQKIEAIAKKYGTTPEMVRRYMDGHYVSDNALINPVYHQIQPEDGHIVLKMSPSITQEQFRNLWGAVEACKGFFDVEVNKRNRPPANYELIYYIYKALRSGLDFPAIYELYASNNIPGYDSTDDKAYTEDELRNYYKKYRFYDE